MKKERIDFGNFKGYLYFEPEEVNDNGQLFRRCGFMVLNVKTDVRFAAIVGSVEAANNLLNKNLTEYYQEHPDELEELNQKHD